MPMTVEQATDMLTAAYKAEVEYRHSLFRPRVEVSDNIRLLAEMLCRDNRRFGILLSGTCGNGKTTMLYALQHLVSVGGFKIFKITMARDSEKYSEICEKRREAIKKRWENAHDTNDTKVYKCVQVHTNDTDSDSDSVSDSVSVSDSDIQEANASMSIIDKNIREPKGSLSYNDDPVEKKWTFRDEVISFFNEKMARTSIPLLRSIENQRAKMLKARKAIRKASRI